MRHDESCGDSPRLPRGVRPSIIPPDVPEGLRRKAREASHVGVVNNCTCGEEGCPREASDDELGLGGKAVVRGKGKRQQTPSIVEDGALEGLKKRARDLGLIVNASRRPSVIELQRRTTSKLAPKMRRAAEGKTGCRKKGGWK
jgi:hypothetical protein